MMDKLRPVSFEYTPEYQAGNPALAGTRKGFIAQEVEAVLPTMVQREKETVGGRVIDDFRILNNSDLTPMLVSAVKELKAQNDNLRVIVESQGREIEALKAR